MECPLMKKAPQHGRRQTRRKICEGLLAWYQTKRPLFQYAGIFAGLVLIFCLFNLTPLYQSLVKNEVAWSAKLAHGVLSALPAGNSAVSGGTLLRGDSAILEVKTKCSGLNFCWLFCAAVLAFPAPWGLRIVGAVLGSLILAGMNILRVISLFLVGCYYPGWFAAVHEQVWPLISLVMTMVLMGAWLAWGKGREGTK
jgi:exosortase/archaeosortase family protein